MDGESFDRLSVTVHRLRAQVTRRGALRGLVGGAIAVAGGLFGDEAEAKRRRRRRRYNRCRGLAAKCSSHRDCCSRNCFGNRCFFGGGGGGSQKHCGGRTCPAGWSCCRTGGVAVCVPNTHPTCCGGFGFSAGFTCCGTHHGACPGDHSCTDVFGLCCQPGWKYCSNTGRCCPSGWYCGDIVCEAWQDGEISADSVETVPYQDPIEIDQGDWVQGG